jgi:hypothetical protein
MFSGIKNYIVENPNAFQIASTLVIGIAAFAVWRFVSKPQPPK